MPTRETARLPRTSDAKEFENMCCDVLCLRYKEQFPTIPKEDLFQLHGRLGQDQSGIDIQSNFPTEKSCIVAQCKNYYDVNPRNLINKVHQDIETIIKSFVAPEDSSIEPLNIEKIYIMTALARDAKVQKHFLRWQAKKIKEGEFCPIIEVLFWEDISKSILESHELLNRYYSEFQYEMEIRPQNIVIIKDNNMEIYNNWKKVQLEAFRIADNKINNLLPKKLVNSKTLSPVSFQTEKIINSLLGLGIPMPICFEIAESTANSVYNIIIETPENERNFSTGQIRKLVSMAIQEIHNPDCTKEDIEKWTNRYARRYGNNNQCLQFYFPDEPSKKKDLSLEYIRHDFLDAVINKIVPGTHATFEISDKARRAMSEEILDFINRCDLYQVNYNLMVDMVAEIATQPPHPWIINDALREENLIYNTERIKDNLNKLHDARKKDNIVAQSIILEILHHSAALILGTHNYFFGVYDISAVTRLRDILSYLQEAVVKKPENESDVWDDAIERTKLFGLHQDLIFAGINPSSLYVLLGKLELQVKNTQKNNSPEFIENVERLAEYALRIRNCATYDDLKRFLTSNWSDYCRDDIIRNIQTLFWTLYPVLKYKNRIPGNDHFGVRYINPSLDGYPTCPLKNQFFLIVGLESTMDVGFLDILNDPNKKRTCNTILLISETQDQNIQLYDKVSAKLKEIRADSYYYVLQISKNDLYDLLDEKDRTAWMTRIYNEQTDWE